VPELSRVRNRNITYTERSDNVRRLGHTLPRRLHPGAVFLGRMGGMAYWRHNGPWMGGNRLYSDMGIRTMKDFPNNKFFRRMILIWAMVLITTVVVWTWRSTPEISAGTAAALGSVVGILATVIGFYQWSRKRDDELGR